MKLQLTAATMKTKANVAWFSHRCFFSVSSVLIGSWVQYLVFTLGWMSSKRVVRHVHWVVVNPCVICFLNKPAYRERRRKSSSRKVEKKKYRKKNHYRGRKKYLCPRRCIKLLIFNVLHAERSLRASLKRRTFSFLNNLNLSLLWGRTTWTSSARNLCHVAIMCLTWTPSSHSTCSSLGREERKMIAILSAFKFHRIIPSRNHSRDATISRCFVMKYHLLRLAGNVVNSSQRMFNNL